MGAAGIWYDVPETLSRNYRFEVRQYHEHECDHFGFARLQDVPGIHQCCKRRRQGGGNDK